MELGRQRLGVGAAIARRFGTLQVDRLVRRSSKGTGRYTVIARVEPLAQRILPVVALHFAIPTDGWSSQRQPPRVGRHFAHLIANHRSDSHRKLQAVRRGFSQDLHD